MRPYIGVSGVMTSDEAWAVVGLYREAWRAAPCEPTHDLMIGVLASTKTLAGGTNKYPRRYPRPEQIAGIFPEAPGVLGLIHFASDRPPTDETIFDLDKIGGKSCHGFQFNVTWPSRIDLVNFHGHKVGRSHRVVLQVGPRDIAVIADHDRFQTEQIAKRLHPYVDLDHNDGAAIVTDLLLDVSGGMGVAIDDATAADIVCRVAERTDVRLGIAGGLCAATLTPGIGRLLRAGCSIDAEGRLRDDADGGGNLDLAKVGAYLQAAVRLAAGAP